MGTIQIDGSTPKLTIGNATAEDALILFDGNAQDFYIALDDSADDLLIGLGSTVGTTPAIAIDENLKVNIPVTTASTSASTGSLTTGGGAGIGADLYVGDDVYLITDSAVLGFGADKDTTLTHTDGTGLTLNSTNKLCFNDASQFIQGSSATVISIGATDEIDLTATAVDLNGTLDVSGSSQFNGDVVLAGTTPQLTIGDAGAEDTKIVFDGNAVDYWIGLDDSEDKLVLGTGSTVNTSSQAITIDSSGHVLKPLQSAFFGTVGTVANVTGDDTVYSYIPSEVVDRNADFATSTFTAPVTGLYMATVSHNISGISSMENGQGRIVTSNRTYYWNFSPNNFSNAVNSFGFTQSHIVDMDASDTLIFKISLNGGSKVADVEDTTTMAVFLLG